MKIKLGTVYAGPLGCFQPGAVVEMPTDEALALLSGGYAAPMKEERQTATAGPADTAVPGAPKTASRRGRRGKA